MRPSDPSAAVAVAVVAAGACGGTPVCVTASAELPDGDAGSERAGAARRAGSEAVGDGGERGVAAAEAAKRAAAAAAEAAEVVEAESGEERTGERAVAAVGGM